MKILDRYREKLLALCFLITIPVLDITYFVLNNTDRGVHSLSTVLDYSLPFLKIFVIPYVVWYPFVFLGFLYICFRNTEVYFKTLITFDLCLICSYITFYFFQTTMPRPELIGTDILTNMIRVIYGFDQPFNCFPSIHVLACYVIMRGIDRCEKGFTAVKVTAGIVSVLIILSTLFIKQHTIMDIISAVFLGEIIFTLIKNLNLDRFVYALQGKKVSKNEFV